MKGKISRLSLRARLLMATVVLVVAGLLVADAATYALLRSSLISRIDEQLQGANSFARRVLTEEGGFPPSDLRSNAFPLRAGRARPAGLPVTLLELVDPTGSVIDSRAFGLGSVASPPVLPSGLPGSSAGSGVEPGMRAFTASAEPPSTHRYRVLASAAPGGTGTIVVAVPLAEAEATLRRLLLLEGLVTGSVIAAIAALALWLVRLGLKPLTEMEETAAEIAAGDLSRRVAQADPKTEVGRLGLALNSMLERIQEVFGEREASERHLRQFVADASHELRTPLTSIRGYAELFRRGASTHPEDLSKSMQRIEEESIRMGTLVEELLLLARLDDRPQIERVDLDLAGVAQDAVRDARAIQPGRPIELTAPGPVMVRGDEPRLRQVACNLLSNALQHTPDRTPVTIEVRTDGHEAVMQVADEGPGMGQEDAKRVFDRFFRVDPSRSRDHGGAGLGLSIVASIVDAHQGRVSLETSPGKGARFTIRIPLKGEPPASPSRAQELKAAEL
jgi:two-component system, OmpR family, sensor kinase